MLRRGLHVLVVGFSSFQRACYHVPYRLPALPYGFIYRMASSSTFVGSDKEGQGTEVNDSINLPTTGVAFVGVICDAEGFSPEASADR